jgi:hypothetical protein
MRRPIYNFAIDPDLLAGLRHVKDRDGISESEQIRRGGGRIGSGRVYLRRQIWWVTYYGPDGRRYHESSESCERGTLSGYSDDGSAPASTTCRSSHEPSA